MDLDHLYALVVAARDEVEQTNVDGPAYTALLGYLGSIDGGEFTAMIAALSAAKAENDFLRHEVKQRVDERDDARADRDRLAAEVERLTVQVEQLTVDKDGVRRAHRMRCIQLGEARAEVTGLSARVRELEAALAERSR